MTFQRDDEEMAARPRLGMPDWKVDKRRHRRPTSHDDSYIRRRHRQQSDMSRHHQHHQPRGHQQPRGHRERQERRQERHSSSSNNRNGHKGHQHHRSENPFSNGQRQQQQQDHTRDRDRDRGSSRRGRLHERRERQPQHEIEFVKEEPSGQKEVSAEYALFSFPWNWNTTPKEAAAANPTNNRTTTAGEQQQRGLNWNTVDAETDDSAEKQDGIPSVVFAVTDDNDDDCPSALDESRDRFHNKHKNTSRLHKLKKQKEKLVEAKRGSNQHSHISRLQRHGHGQLQRHRAPDPPVLADEYQPIVPSPQVPILVGNKEDPILCSESLVGSVHRRYTTKTAGNATNVKPPNFRRRNQLRKQTIHDLTALESVSTYDLEQRYHANEVHSIVMANAKNNAKQGGAGGIGRASIALPRLISPTPSRYHQQKQQQQQQQQQPITAQRPGLAAGPVPAAPSAALVSPAASGRIGNSIVYNLSESSIKKRDKVRKSITAHTATMSQSLEKMKNNLRQKQSLLSHAVTDLKLAQKLEIDRLRSPVHDRNPDTAPLLQNQNYISDIFSDIASKLSPRHQPHQQQPNDSGKTSKQPYVPKASDILHHKQKEQKKERERSDEQKPINLVDEDSRDPKYNERRLSSSRNCRPKRSEQQRERGEQRSRRHRHRHEQDIDLPSFDGADGFCDVTAPIAEQLGMFLSPKSNSSLYLPNIRSRRNTPVVNAKLPFRPSTTAADAVAATSATRAPSNSNRSKIESSRPIFPDIIDVTSLASPSLRLKNVVDLTCQATFRDIMGGAAATKLLLQQDMTTPAQQSKRAIDVTSLTSSRLSKTTVKSVTRVDKDSRGFIHAQKKLSAMPKRTRSSNRGPPPTKRKDRGAVEEEEHPWDCDQDDEANANRGGKAKSKQKWKKDETQNQTLDQTLNEREEEGEIVFAPSPDANKGLFDGIWDLEIPNTFTMKNSPPKTPRGKPGLDLPLYKPRDGTSSPSVSKVGLTCPVNMSPWSEGKEKLVPTLIGSCSEERDRRGLLGYLLQSQAAKASAEGQMPSPSASGLHLRGLQVRPSPTSRGQNRGRDPSAIPWAHPRLYPALDRQQQRDAPMTKTSNQREPEGLTDLPPPKMPIQEDDLDGDVAPPSIPLQEDYCDNDPKEADDAEETDDCEEEGEDQLVETPSFPKPCRRTSAFRLTSAPSQETRSVTFQDGDTFLGPKTTKDQGVPTYICTADQSTSGGSSKHSKNSVRRQGHPWDNQSQCSSRKAFHDLSTQEEDKRKRTPDILERARAARGQVPSTPISSKKSSGNSLLRSMYEEVMEATLMPDVILLDAQANTQYNVLPANINVTSTAQELWDDVSESLTSGSHSRISRMKQVRQQWGTAGDASKSRATNAGTGTGGSRAGPATSLKSSKSRQSKSSRRGRGSRELVRDGGPEFFDYLCS